MKLYLKILVLVLSVISFNTKAQDFPITKKHYKFVQLEKTTIINDSSFVQSFGVCSILKHYPDYNNSKFDSLIKDRLKRYDSFQIINDSIVFFEKIYFIDTFFVSGSYLGQIFQGKPHLLFTKNSLLKKHSFIRYKHFEKTNNNLADKCKLKYDLYTPVEIEYDSINNQLLTLFEYQTFEKKLDTKEVILFKNNELNLNPKNDKWIDDGELYVSIFQGLNFLIDDCQINKENFIPISDNAVLVLNCNYTDLDVFYDVIYKDDGFDEAMKKLFSSFKKED